MSNPWKKRQLNSGGQGTAFCIEKDDKKMVMKELNHDPHLDKDWEELTELKRILLGRKIAYHRNELITLKESVHPNIVAYLEQPSDFVYDGKHFPIFMEFCEEGSLKDVIPSKTLNYSVATIEKWAREIFSALEYLAGNSIAHRDVKPANIFVTNSFDLKLGDFGIVKRFEAKKTQTITSIGTPRYMAPEIRDGMRLNQEDLCKCDVYSTGLVLWELMERKEQFFRPNPITFHKSWSSGVKGIQELIISCTAPLCDRPTAEAALEKMNWIQKNCYISEATLPQRCPNQNVLKLPTGLCLEEEENDTWEPFDATFGNDPDASNLKVDKKTTSRLGKTRGFETLHQEFITVAMPKIEAKPNFRNITILENGKCLDFESSRENGIDVNKFRESIVSRFMAGFSPGNDHLIDQMRRFEEKCDREKEMSFDYYWKDVSVAHFSDLMGPIPLDENFPHFADLIYLDLSIQELCMRFAIHTLWQCDSRSLNFIELFDLIDLSIYNIAQSQMVFTCRRSFPVIYLENSRTEWCEMYRLACQRDFSQIREYEYSQRSMAGGRFGKEVIIDLEPIRRTLLDRRAAIKRNTLVEGETHLIIVDKERTVWVGRLEKYKGLRVEDLMKRIKTKDLYFPGYVFMIDSVPKSIVPTSCKCLQESVCPIAHFPSNAPAEMALKYSNCPGKSCLEFLEFHSLFARAFRVLNDWDRYDIQQFTHLYLIEQLLKDIGGKDSSVGFLFLMIREKQKIDYCHEGESKRNGLLIGYGSNNEGFLLLNKSFHFESIKENCLIEAMGIVSITLGDLVCLLEAMVPILKPKKQERSFLQKLSEMFFGSDDAEETVDEEDKFRHSGVYLNDPLKDYAHRQKMKLAIKRFWSGKKTL